MLRLPRRAHAGEAADQLSSHDRSASLPDRRQDDHAGSRLIHPRHSLMLELAGASMRRAPNARMTAKPGWVKQVSPSLGRDASDQSAANAMARRAIALPQ